MTFIADPDQDKAIDLVRGLEFFRKGGAYNHAYFELSDGHEIVEVLALSFARPPTPEENTRWPDLPNVVVWNVLSPMQVWDLSETETRKVISEALRSYEALIPSSRVRLVDVLFNDPRYMDTPE